MPNRSHEPTDLLRQTVSLHAAVGTPQDKIAQVIGIDKKTLTKHYREELDLGMVKANARVGKSLFDKAVAGDTTAAIWWSKCRMGWKETSALEMSGPGGGPIETKDSSALDAIRSRLNRIASAAGADTSEPDAEAD